jgi:hypothetical protein
MEDALQRFRLLYAAAPSRESEHGGSSIPGPMLMSTAANVMSWCTLALTVYVWYRLGWMPALAFFVFPFILAMIVENIELFVFRFPTNVMSLVGIPVAIISFVALIVSVLTL